MRPRVKKPLMVQLMDPQMKLKQRALMGQEKRQLPTVERAPLMTRRAIQRVTARQRMDLMSQARMAVMRRAKRMPPLQKALRQMKQEGAQVMRPVMVALR